MINIKEQELLFELQSQVLGQPPQSFNESEMLQHPLFITFTSWYKIYYSVRLAKVTLCEMYRNVCEKVINISN